jgi:glycine/D-amino acid oxidase-like deaminating enzyme
LNDFFIAGGQFRRAELPRALADRRLGKTVVINCTGYGARALWKDETLIPVRGQIARPDPAARCALWAALP